MAKIRFSLMAVTSNMTDYFKSINDSFIETLLLHGLVHVDEVIVLSSIPQFA
jgi:hypothetical protein